MAGVYAVLFFLYWLIIRFEWIITKLSSLVLYIIYYNYLQ